MTSPTPRTLAELTTMRVGGAPERLVSVNDTEALVEALREADTSPGPVRILGGGSNIVADDGDLPGTVIHVATRGITVESASDCGGVMLRVAAGEMFDDVVVHAVAQGWSGIETLAGIPGTVGATPVQNVGAYGAEVGDTLARVRLWDRDERRVVTVTADQLGLGYRTSDLKRSIVNGSPRRVVLEVTFQLRMSPTSQPVAYADLAAQLGVDLGARVPLAEAREAVLAQRRRRGMVLDPADVDTWSCGSFFTNPVLSDAAYEALAARAAAIAPERGAPPSYPVGEGQTKTSAAWLIETAGFGKGFGLPGPAALSTKHVLAVTNRGAATSAEVLALAGRVRQGVSERLGVSLEMEPVRWQRGTCDVQPV